MNYLAECYKHRIKSTGEIIEELPYKGLRTVDAVKQFVGFAPHSCYRVGDDMNDVGCILTVCNDNGDRADFKLIPGSHVIKRANGDIEVWNHGELPPYIEKGDLEVIDKWLIFG